ncbi:cytosolic Fe-S cluster assembly factor cfd1 [Mycoemilia scoparia]|uniref:Cytosolic Fe-S cluster assembly factor cfd1 n=1 Tax=Mycoemilia scoparia TaxID=417184 RepID=A0A9W7ZTQ0_9FUNG|nr:cytosolic Fe-S cluster assembly factor cfd1 [Mycoemilia scoparia]
MSLNEGIHSQKQHMDVGQRLRTIKHVVLILSGKGGVGKSSVTAQLALSLVQANFKVGVLDIDLCGPSIPRMLGLDGKKIHQASAGWVPVFADEEQRLACMSIGFLLPDKNSSVVWRGPKKNAMIKQFLTDVYWGELDFLLIDTPPGTSDEHLSVLEYLQEWSPDGAVLVTTPQGVSLSDVRKEYNFCMKVGLNVLGIIENMSGFQSNFVASILQECTNVFSTGGGEAMAKEFNINFLGKVPIDPSLTLFLDQAPQSGSSEKDSNNKSPDGQGSFEDMIRRYQECKLSSIFSDIIGKLTSSTSNGSV